MYSTPLNCFTNSNNAVPIHIVFEKDLEGWLKQQPEKTQTWASINDFSQKKLLLLSSEKGALVQVICLIKNEQDWMSLGALPLQLPQGVYVFEKNSDELLKHACLAWGMGAYQFTRYKKAKREAAQLVRPGSMDLTETQHLLESIYLIRDLINTPADDMMPSILAAHAKELAKEFNASFTEIVGKDLLKENYPCVYHVGRASTEAPRLLELRWGDTKNPKVTLVGKGVCFDSGGLDIKSASGMLLMKKDMGGAAHVLSLARLIMARQLPIQLRVLVPAVENAVSGNAYHPGDILTSRSGKTVEILNTDAEGRLILCDALTAAAEENPDVIIDFATLTGAAKIAVGTEIASFFTDDEILSEKVQESSQKANDPCWRMPLYKPYRKLLDSTIADIANCSLGGYAGAITAALYLQEFMPATQKWIHFDIMAANLKTAPGRPEGGEASGLRAVYEVLKGGTSSRGA